MIKNEVETAVGVINTYYSFYQEGTMTEQQAKDSAKRAIKDLRYGTEGLLAAGQDNKNEGYTTYKWEKPEDVGTGKLTTKMETQNYRV